MSCLHLRYVLELITPISKVFEGEGLLISQVKPTLTETITVIKEEIEVAGTDEELLTSNLATFRVTDDLTIQRSFVAADDHRSDNSNKQQIDIDINGMINDKGERSQASEEKFQAL